MLYADADMNKADWMTAAAAIVGVLGIGLGLWWLDSSPRSVIAGIIPATAGRTCARALGDLMDSRASVFDDRTTAAPLRGRDPRRLRCRAGGGRRAGAGPRGGARLPREVFVVPSGADLGLGALERIRDAVRDVDWKLHHVVVTPVRELPLGNLPPP